MLQTAMVDGAFQEGANNSDETKVLVDNKCETKHLAYEGRT